MASDHQMIERLIGAFESGGAPFAPEFETPLFSPELPGRHPGTHVSEEFPRMSPADAVVLDCGISRMEPFTHVLWISAAAESILGSHGHERLGQVIGGLDGVEASTWEGDDRLHVRAPGVAWETLLAHVRAVVEYRLLS